MIEVMNQLHTLYLLENFKPTIASPPAHQHKRELSASDPANTLKDDEDADRCVKVFMHYGV